MTACDHGFYGQNCSLDCGRCSHNETCDRVTGQCPGGLCLTGYSGDLCKSSKYEYNTVYMAWIRSIVHVFTYRSKKNVN